MRFSRETGARLYWNTLVVGSSPEHVEQVGHPDMGSEFNRLAYDLRLHALVCALQKVACFPPPDNIFEAAFGVGYYLKFWHSQHCRRVVGVDLSAQACQNATRHFPEFDLREGDLAEINQWEDWLELVHSFAVVTAIDVIYHLVEEDAACRALCNVAQLVAPKGILVLTDKFAQLPHPVQEVSGHVTRRCLDWYTALLKMQGLVLECTVPVFWCMDPPSRHNASSLTTTLAYAIWGMMRSGIKFWPHNGRVQNFFGKWFGTIGKILDYSIVSCLHNTSNLTLAVFRKN
jgi:SAM-dependent methyltransferase